MRKMHNLAGHQFDRLLKRALASAQAKFLACFMQKKRLAIHGANHGKTVGRRLISRGLLPGNQRLMHYCFCSGIVG